MITLYIVVKIKKYKSKIKKYQVHSYLSNVHTPHKLGKRYGKFISIYGTGIFVDSAK